MPARFSWPPPPTRALGGGRRGRGRWLGGGPLTVGEKDENAALLCSGTWKLWYSSGPYCGREQGSARPAPRAPRRRGLHARSRNENKTPRTQRALWVPAALPPTAPRRWSERTANTMPPSSSGAARAGPSSLAAHPLSQGIPESWPVVFVAAESPRERASREASTSPTGGHSGQIWLLRAHPARVCERGFLVGNERFASGPLLSVAETGQSDAGRLSSWLRLPAPPRGVLGLPLAPLGGSPSLRAAGSLPTGQGCSNKFLRPLPVSATGVLSTPGPRPVGLGGLTCSLRGLYKHPRDVRREARRACTCRSRAWIPPPPPPPPELSRDAHSAPRPCGESRAPARVPHSPALRGAGLLMAALKRPS